MGWSRRWIRLVYFQTSLFEYQLYDPAKDVYRTNFGYKTLEGDTRLDLELVNYGGTPLEQFMRYTDWTSPKQTFTIEQSSVTNLVMSCEGRRIRLRNSKISCAV